MKHLITIALLLSTATLCHAEEKYIDVTNKKEISKVDAMRILILNSNAAVQKCVDVELSKKGTLVKKD